ncbi:MAG: DUF2085 domain-containing protein [Chloroflexota bacterium]
MSNQKKPVTGRSRNVALSLNKFVYRLSRNWVSFFNLVVGIYVGLPILAPILLNFGVNGPASVIYTMYSPMCHQMASRSFFLFGEQVAYPRELADSSLTPLEAYTADIPEFAGVADDNWADFFIAARNFRGNEQLGYKMALCERDIAIYGFLFIGGLIYAVLRRRYDIKPIPLWAFIMIGMGPIGLDGFSQLFGYYATPIDGSAAEGFGAFLGGVFPIRESSPFLRTFTGAVFGLMLAWLIYPHLNNSFQDTESQIETKLRRIDELP